MKASITHADANAFMVLEYAGGTGQVATLLAMLGLMCLCRDVATVVNSRVRSLPPNSILSSQIGKLSLILGRNCSILRSLNIHLPCL
jgi:hypothetical protein